jgi:hypothetical protein
MATINKMSHKSVTATFTMEEWTGLKAWLGDAATLHHSGAEADRIITFLRSITPSEPPRPNPLHRKSR